MIDARELLFSYGTLQQPDVQRAQFGRLLNGQADALCGYRVGRVAISDPDVVRKSGLAHHPALVASGDAADRISGTAFRLTTAELGAADAYEAGEYTRACVTLESGSPAWVYVAAPGVKVA